MGQGKSPWYTHRLMHRKRVTSKLHDSYFRLMTIKHAIPKIEWAIELLYNSVTGSQTSWRSDELETRCSRESHTRLKGPQGPRWSLGTRPVGDKMQKRKTAEWAPGTPVEYQENEKDTTLMAIRVGVNILQFCSVSISLSHANVTNKVRGIFF